MSDSAFDRAQRELRRTRFLNDAVDAAVRDVRLALASGQAHALAGAIHKHLTDAYNEGAGERADLLSALDTAWKMRERVEPPYPDDD